MCDDGNSVTRTTWTYDRTYQLEREERGGVATAAEFGTTYTYDPVGNRLLMEDSGTVTTSTYDAANELKTEDLRGVVTSYSYDEAGNRTKKEHPDGDTDYTWNDPSRLAEVDADALSDPVTFTYNAAGKRTSKQTGATTTINFLYDFNRLRFLYRSFHRVNKRACPPSSLLPPQAGGLTVVRNLCIIANDEGRSTARGHKECVPCPIKSRQRKPATWCADSARPATPTLRARGYVRALLAVWCSLLPWRVRDS